MSLIRYNPWTYNDPFGRHSSRLFEPLWRTTDADEGTTLNDWLPAIDIKEEDDQYLLRADIPGVDADDLDVTLDNGVLTLQGKRETQTDEDSNGLRRVERVSGKFYRRFNLPDSTDAASISADYRNGVLEVAIPKKEQPQRQRIQVKVS